MSTRPQRRKAPASTAVSLRRWLCVWLALLTVTQLIGSTLAAAQGAWHRHRPLLQATAASTPLIRWRHGEAVRVARLDAHAQMHARGEAHDHAATDASVLPFGADAASEASAQWALAWAPGVEARWCTHDAARHVRASTPAWAPTMRSIAPPLQPPRA